LSRIRIALASLAAVAAVVGVVAGSSFAAAAKTSAVVKPTVVQVKASEFHYALSVKTIAKPGTVSFVVKNIGKIAHNFVVLSGINKTTPLIAPNHSATLKVTFKKKGSYIYECTVGEHATEGMFGKFIVK
jgi:plastocyanin